ncbi:hypothetical protein [Algoriphagus sp.]|uniref:hypothetical protein n=1 Tax=Algoriphagus sp. TaxID=1872435 RepID=UPI003F6EF1C0
MCGVLKTDSLKKTFNEEYKEFIVKYGFQMYEVAKAGKHLPMGIDLNLQLKQEGIDGFSFPD